MDVQDLVRTPDGVLAIVEEIAENGIRVKERDSETRIFYPAGTALTIVEREAAAVKEG
jgi:hypothetical protein